MAEDRGRRVVVLGAGFAGIQAVKMLARAGVAPLWIDGQNYHCFLPLLYQIATAGLEPQQIAYPVRSILRRLPAGDFRMARIVACDPRSRTLTTDTGDAIAYDYLIIATGSGPEDFGIPGVREATFGLYGLEDARRLRNHILRGLEASVICADVAERAAFLRFVIVGGGPTGVETAGALAEFRRHVVTHDYRGLDPATMHIVLVEAGPDVLAPFSPRLRQRARRDLAAFGVDVRTGTAVTRVTSQTVELSTGEVLATRTVVWAAGVRARPETATLGLPTGRAGRILVEPTLQVRGEPHVFAAGDVALVAGDERLPQVAQVAIQQGELAARNVVRALRGDALETFHYRDKGAMATIGRSSAVARIGSVELTGFVAWGAWLVVHLVMLIGFRNRAVTLVNWAWNYFTYDRGLRAIVGDETPAVPAADPLVASGPLPEARRVAGGGFEPPTSRL